MNKCLIFVLYCSLFKQNVITNTIDRCMDLNNMSTSVVLILFIAFVAYLSLLYGYSLFVINHQHVLNEPTNVLSTYNIIISIRSIAGFPLFSVLLFRAIYSSKESIESHITTISFIVLINAVIHGSSTILYIKWYFSFGVFRVWVISFCWYVIV